MLTKLEYYGFRGAMSMDAIDGSIGALARAALALVLGICARAMGWSPRCFILAATAAVGTLYSQSFVYAPNWGSQTISGYSINSSTGALTPVPGSPFPTPIAQPFYIVVDPTSRFVYMNESPVGSTAGSVSVYSINRATGALTEIPGSPFSGQGPAGVAIDPTGKFFYSDDPYTDSLLGFTIDAPTGALGTPLSGSPFATGPFPYDYLAIHPNGRFLYFTNAAIHGGQSSLSGFSMDTLTGALTPLPGLPIPVASPATHTVIDASGRFVYFAVGAASIYGFSIDGTTGSLSLLPGAPFAAACTGGMATDHQGRFVFVSGADGTVSVLRIDQNSGALSLGMGSPYMVGVSPSGMAVDATNNFLYVAVTGPPSNVSAFSIDQTTGALSPVQGSPFASGLQPRELAIATIAPSVTTGTINVTTNIATATFTITGPSSYRGSGKYFSVPNAPFGRYTITYDPILGYTTPSSETQDLPSGGSITFNGDYRIPQPALAVGSLSLNCNVSSATASLSPSVTGLSVSGPYPAAFLIPAGNYVLTFASLTGYTEPPPTALVVAAGSSQLVACSYRTSGAPPLNISPNELHFEYDQSVAGPPAPETLFVGSSSTSIPFSLAVVTPGITPSWLGTSISAGNTNSKVLVHVAGGLPQGTYTGKIVVSAAAAANSPQIIPVTLTVNSPPIPQDTTQLQILCRPIESNDLWQLTSRIGRHCYFLLTERHGTNNHYTTFGAYPDPNTGQLTPLENSDLDSRTRTPLLPNGCGSDPLATECVSVPILANQTVGSIVQGLQQAIDEGPQGAYNNTSNNSNLWVQRRIDSLHLAVTLPNDVITSSADVCRLYPLLIQRLAAAGSPFDSLLSFADIVLSLYGIGVCL